MTDLSHPSWPARLDAHRDGPFLADCLESIRDDATKAGDRDVAREAQYAIDTGDLAELDALFDADGRDQPPRWSDCVAFTKRIGARALLGLAPTARPARKEAA